MSDLHAEKQRLLLSTARLSQTLTRLEIGSEEYKEKKLRYDLEVERISEINSELHK